LVDGPDHAEPSSIEAAAMAFKLVHAKYDRQSERAYVELFRPLGRASTGFGATAFGIMGTGFGAPMPWPA
jgi:hypothetical protein